MNIAACEDQTLQLDLLNTQIKNWAKEKKVNISIDNFINAESFLFQWSDYDQYDIIFLDVELDKMSGIELSNIIRERNKVVDIVFVTGFFKYALHGYRVGALQYLIKPLDKLDLYFCLDKTMDRINNKDESSKIIIETPKKLLN